MNDGKFYRREKTGAGVPTRAEMLRSGLVASIFSAKHEMGPLITEFPQKTL